MNLKLLLLILILPITALAQYQVSGVVQDSDGNPIADTEILLSRGAFSKSTTSDASGFYKIEGLKTGTYVLEITTGDFIDFDQIMIQRSNLKHNIKLKNAKDYELGEVALRGETIKSKMEKKGFAVSVIETKEASFRNVQTNELLNQTVGVKLRQNGGLGSRVQYSLNGLSGNAVSIFIDGIPISVYGSSFSLNSIPPAMIKRIEVYKGVVPAHLADDALGGAINIVLNQGAKNNLNASISYGSFNTTQANLNALYRFEESGFTVKASGFYNYSDNDYKVSGRSIVDIDQYGRQTPITARRFNDAYRSNGGMFQAGFTNTSWADQFFIGITASDDYNEVQQGVFPTINPYNGRYTESDALLANLTYQKKDLFIEGLDVNVHGTYGERNTFINDTVPWAYTWSGKRMLDINGNYLKLPSESQQEGGPTLQYNNREVSSIRSGISYAINKHHKFFINHVYTGLIREDHDEVKSLLENTFKEHKDLHKSIYSLSYELKAFQERLQLNLFGKHYRQKVYNNKPVFQQNENGEKSVVNEIYESNKNYTGYGAAASFEVLPNVTLITSAEKAIRLPSETEVFGNPAQNTMENPSIMPEIANNYNFGLSLGSFHFNNHRLKLSTNVFTRDIQDRIGLPLERNPNSEVTPYVNQGSVTSTGIDAELNYSYKTLGFIFNISHLELKQDNGVGIAIPNTPFFMMNTSLRYAMHDIFQKNSVLNFFYNAQFTGEFYYIQTEGYGSNVKGLDEFLVPQQIGQDLGVSYSFPNNKVVLSVDVKNILDEPLYDNLRVQRPGRAFYLKLNYSFNKF
ncbi:TonB-dependent receptor [Zunongwangia sp. HGR-M22]|uniref:TonB-dependent receptor n=1 Tax=Zunongwangia sp. HGR-M22 TaxID=3015168 RepID=UPI0022DE3DDC|nr:TonB-dependent receptor [Zunongwangia sp. HGR-M22]WBL25469.1 TonB-dependent receptor [Zunongwangia sp. HGR-M22]